MTGAEFEGVDFDLLADYVGGALDGTPDEDRVAALVAGDPAWREAHELLAPGMAAVGAALGGLDPEPMPGDVAARLDALFATPAAPPVEDLGDGASRVPTKVLDLEEHRRRRRPRRLAPLGVAAGVLALAGAAMSWLPGVSLDDASDSGSADSEAAGAAGEVYAQSGPALAAAPPAERIARSGTDYTAETLTQSPALGAPAATASDQPRISAQNEPSTDLALLLDCLAAIARENGGAPLDVQSVDYARYQGAPATIVRFSAANGTWVWAVGPRCGTPDGGADALEQLPVR
ncbi:MULTISPECIES: hypothetical protein [Actinoplanes]|uniref:hypothetical protein n=1 Tax=Actinoplanes TaxID=1865 RepID=UPI0005F2A5B2|nr:MULTISPECIES: hypothetical protein [Actinoplanes]GLY08557.1 hypothetical protein Acsp01_89360 [Actinoplanes sp. NBRC 101535]